MRTAILVDGGFFVRRYRRLFEDDDPQKAARKMHELCLDHLCNKKGERVSELYRILFYDCAPLNKKIHLPVSGKILDFSKTDAFNFRTQFHKELKRQRSVALRRGQLHDGRSWIVRPEVMKRLMKNEIRLEDLTDEHFTYDVRQKGVDMKIGLDIAALAYKRLVDQIVLVAGDSDFVPAAKLARREGLDVVLDPMWQPVSEDLFEHIDGLRSTSPNPRNKARGKGANA